MKKQLLKKLESKDPSIRNDAAIEFIDFVEECKNTLLFQITNKQNSKHHGTLVYALGHLNCSDNFEFLFDLLLKANYEAFLEAFSILGVQDFQIDEDIKQNCLTKFSNFQNSLSNFNFSEEQKTERLEKIRKVVDYFLD